MGVLDSGTPALVSLRSSIHEKRTVDKENIVYTVYSVGVPEISGPVGEQSGQLPWVCEAKA